MKKVDKTVLKETKYIALWVVIFSVLMEAVFLILSKWDYTVLTGNLLGAVAAVGNFFLMGLTVQKAVQKEDEKDVKKVMRISQVYRNLLVIVILIAGVCIPVFNTWTVVIPVFFPRISLFFRPLFDKKSK